MKTKKNLINARNASKNLMKLMGEPEEKPEVQMGDKLAIELPEAWRGEFPVSENLVTLIGHTDWCDLNGTIMVVTEGAVVEDANQLVKVCFDNIEWNEGLPNGEIDVGWRFLKEIMVPIKPVCICATTSCKCGAFIAEQHAAGKSYCQWTKMWVKA